MSSNISKAYANALLDIATEQSKLKDYFDISLNVFKQFEDENTSEYFNIIANKSVKWETKETMIKAVFGKDVPATYLNFLLSMGQNNDLSELKESLKIFISNSENKLNIRSGIVYSVNALDAKQIKKIESALTVKLDSKVTLTNKVDKKLIGGIKVEFKDMTVDNSIKNKLEDLRIKLKEGKN